MCYGFISLDLDPKSGGKSERREGGPPVARTVWYRCHQRKEIVTHKQKHIYNTIHLAYLVISDEASTLPAAP